MKKKINKFITKQQKMNKNIIKIIRDIIDKDYVIDMDFFEKNKDVLNNFRFKDKNTNTKHSIDFIILKFDNFTNQKGEIIKCLNFNKKHENINFPYFDDVTDLKKMCDFIVLCEMNSEIFVFLIEEKSCRISSDNEKIQSQIEAGAVFANFLLNSTQRLYNQSLKNINLKKNYLYTEYTEIRLKVIVNNQMDPSKVNKFYITEPTEDKNMIEHNNKVINLNNLIHYINKFKISKPNNSNFKKQLYTF